MTPPSSLSGALVGRLVLSVLVGFGLAEIVLRSSLTRPSSPPGTPQEGTGRFADTPSLGAGLQPSSGGIGKAASELVEARGYPAALEALYWRSKTDDSQFGAGLATFREAALLAWEYRKPTEAEVLDALRRLPWEAAMALVDISLIDPAGSPNAALDRVIQMLSAAYDPGSVEAGRGEIEQLVFTRWMAIDPDQAIAFLATKRGGDEAKSAAQSWALSNLALHPTEASNLLARFGTDVKTLGANAFKAHLSPAQVRIATKGLSSAERGEFLKSFAGTMEALSPQDFTLFAQEFRPGELPEFVAHKTISWLAQFQPNNAAAWLSPLDADGRASILGPTAPGILSRPGTEGIARFVLEEARKDTKLTNTPAVLAAAANLARQGFNTALRELEGLPESIRPQAIKSAWEARLSNLKVSDAASLPGLIAEMPAGNRSALVSIAVKAMAAQDYDRTRESIEMITDPSLRASAAFSALEASKGSIQERAERFLALTRSEGGKAGAQAVKVGEGIVRKFAAEKVSDAIGWIDRIPDETVRAESQASLSRYWSSLDPVAASDWIAGMPGGRGRDLALQELVAAAKDDPERALHNASSIGDPALRLSAARGVLKAWEKGGPEYVQRLLTGQPFSEDEKRVLLQALEGNR